MPAVVKANKDFQQTQIKNVVIDSVTADPPAPAVGQMWYRSDLKSMSYYDGSSNIRMAQTQTTMTEDDVIALNFFLGG